MDGRKCLCSQYRGADCEAPDLQQWYQGLGRMNTRRWTENWVNWFSQRLSPRSKHCRRTQHLCKNPVPEKRNCKRQGSHHTKCKSRNHLRPPQNEAIRIIEQKGSVQPGSPVKGQMTWYIREEPILRSVMEDCQRSSAARNAKSMRKMASRYFFL